MTISTPNSASDSTLDTGEIITRQGNNPLGDSLTLLRALLGPLVAALIIFGWPLTGYAILASIIFAAGALTDLFDDMIGGPSRAGTRMFSWFDDIADAVLIGLTLLAMVYVIDRGGYLKWTLTVPALIYISRDLLVGLVKGYELRRFGLPKSKLGDIKSALAMLGISLMLAAPWLQQLINRVLDGTNGEKLYQTYSQASPWVWLTGQLIFSIAAILAVITGLQILFSKRPDPANPEASANKKSDSKESGA